MKVTLNELYSSFQAFKEILNCDFINGEKTYYLTKLYYEIENEVRLFEEFSNKLIKKYGTKKNNGNYSIDPDSDNLTKYIDEITPILNKEIELKHLKDAMLKLDVIKQNKTLKPAVFISCKWLFDN